MTAATTLPACPALPPTAPADAAETQAPLLTGPEGEGSEASVFAQLMGEATGEEAGDTVLPAPLPAEEPATDTQTLTLVAAQLIAPPLVVMPAPITPEPPPVCVEASAPVVVETPEIPRCAPKDNVGVVAPTGSSLPEAVPPALLQPVASSAPLPALPTTEPVAPPPPEPVEGESLAPATEAVGTATAKQVAQMKKTGKPAANARNAEKVLPRRQNFPEPPSQPERASAKPDAAPVPAHEPRETGKVEVSAPGIAAPAGDKAAPVTNDAGVESARPAAVEKAFGLVTERIVSFKRVGVDSAEVNLRPDRDTEITLQLRLSNGHVEVAARLERGNFEALRAHWGELQQSLSQQGVRVGALAAAAPVSGGQFSFDASQQGARHDGREAFERAGEGVDDWAWAGAMSKASREPKHRQPEHVRGWERWA